MKILHILNDGSTDLSKKVIDVQSKEHNVKVINLSKNSTSSRCKLPPGAEY